MRDITPKDLLESPNKALNDDNQGNKDFILAMQSHFIRNDLQKIIFMLELMKMGNHENSEEKIEKMYQLCERTNKKLETIDRIHRVIHSDFLKPRGCSSLIDLIEETGSQFDFILKINYESINYQIKVDGFFRDLLFELFSFIGNLNVDQVGVSGGKCEKNPNYFALKFSESKNVPFSKDICEKLLRGLKTDEWDYLGDNIEITLVSMITHYYGGKLTIHSSREIGNCYTVLIPYSICIPNSINQNQRV
ncbi:MAG: hypothetical protein ACXADY_26585 [Candidatus Hodarchaeales archaeon]|jgi:signal transduction histidine kinase